MEVLKDGTFIDYITNKDLSRCLRPSEKTPRNMKFLVKAEGAIGIDDVLSALDSLEESRISSPLFIDGFPYPQLFAYNNLVIICTKNSIYEYANSSITLMIGSIPSGNLWSAVVINKFVYMSNGVVSVIRDGASGIYSISSNLPIAEAICNYNGQIMVGAVK